MSQCLWFLRPHGRRWWRASLAVVAIEPVTFVFMARQPIEPLVDHPATRKRKREGSQEKSRYISCFKPDGQRMSDSKPKPDLFYAFQPFFFFLTIQSLLRVVFHRATLFTHQRTPISGSSSSAGNPLGIKADFFLLL